MVDAFARAGAASVSVVARRESAARECADLAGPAGRVGEPAGAAAADLIVNATPIGMQGTDMAAATPLVDASLLGGGQIAVDLVYHPRTTAWLEAAIAAGAQGVGGLGMLVHQAAIQIEHWTGEQAPIDEMWSAAEREMGDR